MKLENGEIFLSPSDAARFSYCKHASYLDLKLLKGDKVETSKQDDFNILVQNVNAPPIIESKSEARTEVFQDKRYVYEIRFSDQDLQVSQNITEMLVVDVENKPDWLTYENKGSGIGLLIGTPNNKDASANYNMKVVVRDKVGAIDEQELSILVRNINDKPVIDSKLDVQSEVLEDRLYEYKIRISDPDQYVSQNSKEELSINLEGKPSPRTVIIEFPNVEDAKNFYNSKEYQEAINAAGNTIKRSYQIVEGI